jgi:hypothetical protein
MTTRILTVTLLIVLAGCESWSFATWATLQTGLDNLNGQPVKVAFAQLGYPNNEGVVAGQKVFVWSTSNSMCFPPRSRGAGAAPPEPDLRERPIGRECRFFLQGALRRPRASFLPY